MVDSQVITVPSTIQDITGQKFGRLTVIGFSGCRKTRFSRKRIWMCRCECGTEKQFVEVNIVTGNTRSCGCLRREIHRTSPNIRKHGYYGKAEYNTWSGIKQRCFTKECAAYPDYGGRGITMCDLWKDSFEAFIAHVGPKPSANHTIDRINNDGNYEPGNVRWTDRKTQARNRRSSRKVEFRGESRPLAEWAELLGVTYSMLYERLRAGWTTEEAFTAKFQSRLRGVRKPALND